MARLPVKGPVAALQDECGNCILTPPCRAPKHSAGNQTEKLQWQQLPPTCSTVASAPLILGFCTKVLLQFSTSCARSPRPRRHLDLSTGHLLCLSQILHAPPKGRTLPLSHLYRAPGCNIRYPSVLNLVDASQIWTLPLESTLSWQGKSCCFFPEGVLSMPLLSPSSVFWNFLECQMATLL